MRSSRLRKAGSVRLRCLVLAVCALGLLSSAKGDSPVFVDTKIGTVPVTSAAEKTLAEAFVRPPDSARPWVYSFWLEGNISSEGITADLEAMRRSGIGGLLFMDGDMGNPKGPHRFMSDSWRTLFKHLVSEADRLGLEVNLNNAPGWAGSGGPWVTPEHAAQRVVQSETIVEGPRRFDAVLPQPPTARGFYRDIVVLAYPAPTPGEKGQFRRIENFDSTKSFAGVQDFAACVPWPRSIPTNPHWPLVPAAQCVSSAKVKQLTERMDRSGRLRWDLPAGRWLILRIGHTLAGGTTRSSQAEATGLECDKLSRSAVEAHWSNMVGKLLADVGPLAGKTIVSTHIDSWEAGSGNWTDGMRDEFRRLRGYDPLPYLPTLGGLVVDSLEVSERFLWDYRETVCELLLHNYAEHIRKLAHAKGLRLSIEGYDGTCDDLRFAGRADEPMCEFWQRGCYTGLPLCDVVEEMTSAAHVYGRPIVAAEAFTSWRGDFLDHPATLKPLGDWAFCAGVNRFCFSEWIMQPWPERVPGVSFLFIGTVFHRSLSWWSESRPWHEYLARCQFMLRQGRFVADVCFVAPEGAPCRFVAPIPTEERGIVPERPGHNFDGCPAELVVRGMKVEGGRVVLPSGMSYRLLVLPTYVEPRPVLNVQGNYVYTDAPLPKCQTMTPVLLKRIVELVEAGATVLGERPLKSPSLVGYPDCDRELTRLADRLWGKDAGSGGSGRRRVGKGCVLWGTTPAKALAEMQVPADFSCGGALKGKLRYIHRRNADGLDIYFVANKIDAVVQGEDAFFAAIGRPELWWPQAGRIEPLAAFEQTKGRTRIPLRLEPYESVFVVFRPADKRFDPVVSIRRNGQSIFAVTQNRPQITVQKARFGMLTDPARTRDVAEKMQAIVGGGETRFPVARLSEGDDPAMQAAKSLDVEYTLGGAARKMSIFEGETIRLTDDLDPLPVAGLQKTDTGSLSLEACQNGNYDLTTASGRTLNCRVDSLPDSRLIDGGWAVSFPMPSGKPRNVEFDRLISWSRHSDPEIKYFSGTAVYRKTFSVAAEMLADGRAVYLDLGRVAVMARVTINGKDLGLLWTRPFRIDVTPALRVGENRLEVSVTNLPVNRLIGDEQLPEDCQRTPEGQLKSWPAWLSEGKPSPTGRRSFATYRVWRKDSPLQESGLLGPVKLHVTQKVAPR
jgi:hypothetical protein